MLVQLLRCKLPAGVVVHEGAHRAQGALPLARCDITCWTGALLSELLLHLCCHRAQSWPAVLGAIRHLLHDLQAVTEQLGHVLGQQQSSLHSRA